MNRCWKSARKTFYLHTVICHHQEAQICLATGLAFILPTHIQECTNLGHSVIPVTNNHNHYNNSSNNKTPQRKHHKNLIQKKSLFISIPIGRIISKCPFSLCDGNLVISPNTRILLLWNFQGAGQIKQNFPLRYVKLYYLKPHFSVLLLL